MADLGIDGALRVIHGSADAFVRDRAIQARDIAADLHENAPRGGTNLNMYGQPRSAGGEQPAVETGWLLNEIRSGPEQVDELTYDVIVNRAHLEHGTIHIVQRPLGHMTITELEATVRGE